MHTWALPAAQAEQAVGAVTALDETRPAGHWRQAWLPVELVK